MIMKKFKDEMPDYDKRIVVLFSNQSYDILTEQEANLVVCVLKKIKDKNFIERNYLIEVVDNLRKRRSWKLYIKPETTFDEMIENSSWMYL